jgi:folate-binding protein YgfZ
MPNYSILDRKIIKISGPDAKEFLQGLTTNDINSLTTENPLIYSLMLSATGTFFCDFFISQKKGDIYLDVEEARIAEIFKKLSLYKLSADIELEIIDDLKIVFLDQKITEINSYQDPRSKEISFRAILDQNNLEKIQNSPDFKKQDFDFYNKIRFDLKIPDHNDLIIKKSIPAEYGFFDLGAVDFNKGCYIGQEVMARIKYKGVIRKKIYLVEILGNNSFEKGEEITFNDRKIGHILSHIKYDNKILALALLKNAVIDENFDIELELNSNKVKIL